MRTNVDALATRYGSRRSRFLWIMGGILLLAGCSMPLRADFYAKATTRPTPTGASAPVSVQSIAFSTPAASTNLTLLLGSAIGQPVAIAFTPSNATNQNVTWASTNSLVTITPTGPSTATVVADAGATTSSTETITATSADGGFQATCNVTFTNTTVAVTGVSLPSTLALTVGDTSNVTAGVTPSGATNQVLTWASSNTAVATVNSSGTVTAVAVGTATITAQSTDGSSITSNGCVVTVTDTPVTGVTLDNSTLTIVQGGTDVLTATVAPAGASDSVVSWSTSNAGATLTSPTHSGDTSSITINLNSLSAGTTFTVTATSNQDSTKSASCTVTVGAGTLVLAYAYQFNSSGVSVATVTDATGAIGPLVSQGVSSTYLSALTPNGKFLYGTSNVVTPSHVKAYSINSLTGSVSAISITPLNASINTIPSKIVVDPTGKFLYVLNQASAAYSISAFAIDAAGGLTEVPGSPYALLVAPTDLVVDPQGRFLYVALGANNPTPNLIPYSINGATGVLTPAASLSTPTSFPWTVLIDPSGNHLYVTLGTGAIAAYSIADANGNLGAQLSGSPYNLGAGGVAAMNLTGTYLYFSLGTLLSGVSVNGDGTLGSTISGAPYSLGTLSGVSYLDMDPTGRYLYVSSSTGGEGNYGFSMGGSGQLTPIPGFPVSGGNTVGLRLTTKYQ